MDQSEWIRRSAFFFADRTAIIYGEQRWTFAQVNERANRLANGLLDLGVRKGDRVATLRTNCPEHAEIFFALLKIGAVQVTLNPRLTPRDLAWQINDSQATAIILQEQFASVLDGLRDQLPLVRHYVATGPQLASMLTYEQLLSVSSPAEPEVQCHGSDLADLGYTSGTTGKPKGILRDRAGWLAVDRNILLDLMGDATSDDVFLAAQPLYHGAGRFIMPCWVRGITQVIIPSFEPEVVLTAIERHHVTLVKIIPTVLVRLLAHPDLTQERVQKVRTMIYGAAPMPVDRLREALRIFGPIFVQLYGQAEAPMCITYLGKADHVVDGSPDQKRRLASAGYPFTMCEVRVVDEHGQDVPQGETGEVIVRGDHMMRGYWNQSPEMTAETLRDGWVYTRDIGYLDEGGYLFLVDRKSDMIITGGLNVYPNEVEQVLYGHPAVFEAAVIGRKDPEWGEAVTACVALREGHSVSDEELLQFCAGRLAGYKRPRRIERYPAMPKTGNGKISRRMLRDEAPGPAVRT